MENSEIDIEPLSKTEIKAQEENIKKSLANARKKGQLDLIVNPNISEVAAIYIVKNSRGETTYFTSVVPRNSVSISEVKDSHIPEIYTAGEKIDTKIIANNLKNFLHDHYEMVENLPISLYASKKSFLEKEPIAKIPPLPEIKSTDD